MKAKSHLICSLDVPQRNRVNKIARSVAEYVDAFKIHWPVILNQGLQNVRRLADLAPVIVDAKLSDIPNTNRMACEMIFSSGASGVICQGFAGEDAVKACVDAGGEIFVLVEMSHPGSLQFISKHSGEIASMAKEVGAAGIVAPGNRPEKLASYRSIVGPSMQILCPGIGAQGGRPGDAIAGGADFEIVGRSIYNSDNPSLAARAIAESIANRISS